MAGGVYGRGVIGGYNGLWGDYTFYVDYDVGLFGRRSYSALDIAALLEGKL
jgi:hypothetical protein